MRILSFLLLILYAIQGFCVQPNRDLSILRVLNPNYQSQVCAPRPRPAKPPPSTKLLLDETVELESELQCTEGSKTSGKKIDPVTKQIVLDDDGKEIIEDKSIHFKSTMNILKFSPDIKIQFDSVGKEISVSKSAESIKSEYPNYLYIGTGPIFDAGGALKGYLTPLSSPNPNSNSNPIDCSNVATGIKQEGNSWSTENSILVQYRPRIIKKDTDGNNVTENGNTLYQVDPSHERTNLKFRLVSAEFLCKQLKHPAYIDGRYALALKDNPSITREEVEKIIQAERTSETENEDLVEEGQITTAIQSGPAVLRRDGPSGSGESKSLLNGDNPKVGRHNSPGSGSRAYIGIDKDGNLVVIHMNGPNGHYCLGEYLKYKYNITDLLHRDSASVGARYRTNTSEEDKNVIENFPDNTSGSTIIISE